MLNSGFFIGMFNIYLWKEGLEYIAEIVKRCPCLIIAQTFFFNSTFPQGYKVIFNRFMKATVNRMIAVSFNAIEFIQWEVKRM